MAYKMITDAEKAAGRIAGAAEAHADLIAREEAKRWGRPAPEEGDSDGLGGMLRRHARELRRLCELMIRSESAHQDLLTAIRETRQARDEALPVLRDKLYGIREVVDGTHGQQAVAALFLETVPAEPRPLRRMARTVVARLEDPEVVLSGDRVSGVQLDRSDLAGNLEGPLAAMDGAMEELEDHLLPLSAGTLEEKIESHAAVVEKTGKLARFLEAALDLEGHEILSDTVRPSSHRKKKGTKTANDPGGRGDGRKRTAKEREAPREQETRAVEEPAPQPAAPRSTGPRSAATESTVAARAAPPAPESPVPPVAAGPEKWPDPEPAAPPGAARPEAVAASRPSTAVVVAARMAPQATAAERERDGWSVRAGVRDSERSATEAEP